MFLLIMTVNLLYTLDNVFATRNTTDYNYLLVYKIVPQHPVHNSTFFVMFPLVCSVDAFNKSVNATSYWLNETSVWHYIYKQNDTYTIEVNHNKTNSSYKTHLVEFKNYTFILNGIQNFSQEFTGCTKNLTIVVTSKTKNIKKANEHNHTFADGTLYRRLFNYSEFDQNMLSNISLMIVQKENKTLKNETKTVRECVRAWLDKHMGGQPKKNRSKTTTVTAISYSSSFTTSTPHSSTRGFTSDSTTLGQTSSIVTSIQPPSSESKNTQSWSTSPLAGTSNEKRSYQNQFVTPINC
uniref:Ser/thr-rich glycoprotein ORF-Q n=1 Tax=Elephant endotheliotropic herpesvirus 1B TaxID=759754 RepID=A0A075WLJ5_ELHV1|nr:ser/thr-rich glycoprotein ORF-Q [Elephant endotheliotropic herpesvirus 1B]